MASMQTLLTGVCILFVILIAGWNGHKAPVIWIIKIWKGGLPSTNTYLHIHTCTLKI